MVRKDHGITIEEYRPLTYDSNLNDGGLGPRPLSALPQVAMCVWFVRAVRTVEMDAGTPAVPPRVGETTNGRSEDGRCDGFGIRTRWHP